MNILLLVALLTFAVQRPQEILDRAVEDFMSGRIDESVAGFNNLAKVAPDILPQDGGYRGAPGGSGVSDCSRPAVGAVATLRVEVPHGL
jgi:hypothetical protein